MVHRPPRTVTDIPTTLKKCMSVSRLQHITKIGVEDMGDLADSLDDPEVLRLENLDTDLRPPASALAHSKHAVDDDTVSATCVIPEYLSSTSISIFVPADEFAGPSRFMTTPLGCLMMMGCPSSNPASDMNSNPNLS